MRKIFLFLFIFSSFLLANSMSMQEALKIAKKEQKDLLIFIYGDYCYYCKSMEKRTLEDREVKKYLDKRFISIRVNQRDRELLRSDIKTDFIPMTYIISYEDEDILLELPGRKDKETFLSIIKDTLLE